MTTCPYYDTRAMRSLGWYFYCENGHTFHIDDWNAKQLSEGITI